MTVATRPEENTIDVRELHPHERHATIFRTFGSLAPHASMEIVSDHDPQPLCLQFQANLPGKFRWNDLQSGPQVWRVRITKLADAHAAGTCCGACGGA